MAEFTSTAKIGSNAPDEFNVLIEIPSRSSIKYEIDEQSGLLMVDRILPPHIQYPANYGLVPMTKADDGDQLDALVIGEPLLPNCLIKVRPIAVLKMEDEGGKDDKIICVPAGRAGKEYEHIKSVDDLPMLTRKAIETFFEIYKSWESADKWSKVSGWGSLEDAKKCSKKFYVNKIKVSWYA